MSTVTQKNATEEYHSKHDRADDGAIGRAVVEAVAAAEGVGPTDLDARLYDSIDPDALDCLYGATADGTGQFRLSFTFAGYEVVVENDGHILVSELAEDRSC